MSESELAPDEMADTSFGSLCEIGRLVDWRKYLLASEDEIPAESPGARVWCRMGASADKSGAGLRQIIGVSVLWLELNTKSKTKYWRQSNRLSSVANLKSAAGSSIVFEVQVEHFQLRIN